MALARGASHIITGSFPNFSAVCGYLVAQNKPVILGCAAWKGKVNIEDTLFAGAVVARIKDHFSILCDSSNMAETLYETAKKDLYGFLKNRNATHFRRLTNFGMEKDLRYCLTPDLANVIPFYENECLVLQRGR
jgi:2-phosphosulfolactate phosphatase